MKRNSTCSPEKSGRIVTTIFVVQLISCMCVRVVAPCNKSIILCAGLYVCMITIDKMLCEPKNLKREFQRCPFSNSKFDFFFSSDQKVSSQVTPPLQPKV